MTGSIASEETSPGRFRRAAREAHGRAATFGAPTFVGGRDPIPGRNPLRRRWAGGHTPFYPQLGAADCGAACLRMVLAHRGIAVDAQELRHETATGRDGVSALALLRVARRHGLDGRGVRTNLAGLTRLTPGAILFWRFDHFVVLDRASRSGVSIIDPAVGRRVLSYDEADRDFTGVAIEFAPGRTGQPVVTDRSSAPNNLAVARRFLPRTRRWFAALAVSALLLGYALVLPTALGRMAATSGAGGEPFADQPVRFGVLLVLVVVSFGALQVARSRLIVSIQSLLEQRAGHMLMARLTRLPLDFFLARHPGDLAHRVRAAARLKQVISVTTLGAMFDVLLVAGYLSMIAYRQPLLSLLTGGFIALFGTAMGLSWRRERQLSADMLEAHIKTTGETQELLTRITTVKALGAEGAAHLRWMNSFSRELSVGTRKRRHTGILTSFVATIQFAAPLGVLWGSIAVSGGDPAAFPAAVTLSVLTAGLFVSLSNVATAATTMVELAPDLMRMNDILTAAPEPAGAASTWLDEPPSVDIRGVTYRYPGAASDSIFDISAAVPPGGTLVVIGPSGSGKSTLGMLLGALIRPVSGALTIAGRDYANLDPSELRRRIGYVDQHAGLMAGSIVDNIRLGAPDASLEQIRDAAALAEAEGFISSLPMTYETILGPDGAGLSGGQRQRIALARVLVKKPRLLIMDEATSAVDPATEQAIFGNIQRLGITLIVLGHRAALTEQATGVLRMAAGAGEFHTPRQSESTDRQEMS